MNELGQFISDSFATSSSNVVILALCVTVLCVLVTISNFFRKSTVTTIKLTKSKSLCDVSVGLRQEELRTSTSCTSLQNVESERVLSASIFREFKVLKVTRVSHNTKSIRFEIPHGKTLGLSIGRHLTVRAQVDGELSGCKVMRAYTPTSRPDQQGYFDLLVKSYEFGKLSPFLHSLRPGNSVEVRGPVGRFKYNPNLYVAPQSMGLVAGGTGLTPCLQVIRCVLEGQGKTDLPSDSGLISDKTCFTLLFQNRTEEDILLREELDALAAKFPDRLRIIYFLSNPTTTEFGTTGRTSSIHQGDGYGREVRGYINAEVVSAILHPQRCPYVCICGPSGFNNSIKQLLVATGHVDDLPEQLKPTIFTW